MSLNLSNNMILDERMELLIEQLIELNKKIDILETKIDNIYINKLIIVPNNIKNLSDINKTDWNSIHLY